MNSQTGLLAGFCIRGIKEPLEIYVPGIPFRNFSKEISAAGIDFKIKGTMLESILELSIKAMGCDDLLYYVYLKLTYEYGETWSFNGHEDKRIILRQSPHDPMDHVIDMPKQAFPLAAVRNGDFYTALFSDNPAAYDNYSTQELDPENRYIIVSSSDSGENLHDTGKTFSDHYFSEPREFRFYATAFMANSPAAFRLCLFKAASMVFSSNNSLFHAMLFSTNYMHYRKNELGHSDFWIVPGIEYSNKQYTRDAFWQSMILPLEMEQQIYNAVYPERYKYAENALIYIIWSYRLKKRGGDPDQGLIEDALHYLTDNISDGIYRAPGTNGKPSFRSWYDICAFEDNDIITYNQGLYAVAARCVAELGIRYGEDIDKAAEVYNNLFCEKKGYFPLSDKKQFFAVDALAGDLLHYILFGKSLLSHENVKKHYDFMNENAKTVHGYKVTCDENGGYLKADDFGIAGYSEEYYTRATPGMYAWGGSYYLYDMLCLMDCYLHLGDSVIEDMILRTNTEISMHGALHEHMNTANGKPGKANQGWNGAVYSIAEELLISFPSIRNFIDAVDDIIGKTMQI